MGYVPLMNFSRPKEGGHPATNAYCELNVQKTCADGIHNKDFLYQAKAVEHPEGDYFDPVYCKHNGYLKPEIVALQHNFEGMKNKSDEFCRKPDIAKLAKNMTYVEFQRVYSNNAASPYPSKRMSRFIAAWTCAMGSAGCDMAYCAYSFCDLGDDKFGVYDQCSGWDPIKGMPIPPNKSKSNTSVFPGEAWTPFGKPAPWIPVYRLHHAVIRSAVFHNSGFFERHA